MSRTAEDVGFVHLRVHSAYSLLEGALPLKKLAALAAADRMPALGVADTGNLFGALEYARVMVDNGVQPIIGCQVAVDFGDGRENERQGPGRQQSRLSDIVLIAATEEGYWNLVALVSETFLESGDLERPHTQIDRLGTYAPGLIALTGGPSGPIDQAILSGHVDQADERLGKLADLFGDSLYVEVQRHGLNAEHQVEPQLLKLAYARGLPLVATNEPFFSGADDYEAHDALICIAEGSVIGDDNRRHLTPEHRFKTRAEMIELFKDLPEAIQNTIEIAMRVSYWPTEQKPILPRFAGAGADPETADAAEADVLRQTAREGLEKRLGVHGLAPGKTLGDYQERLEYELDVIIRMKYPGYFLIVADFIKWAKSQSIPVGPGRGSGAGSLVAWVLTITDLDPLRFDLLFERFLNPDRLSMPDFDIDFCQYRRDEVIQYVQGKYGRDHVAQIITFGTLQARACLRDVGRVLQMPYGQVDRIAKMIPFNPAAPVTLERAVADEPRLQEMREEEQVVDRLLTIAQKLEGLFRHASTHAAGLVIGDRPLNQLVPLYRDPRSGMPVTQFNMKWVEKAGLVKFDFLGLKTLTVLDTACRLVRKRGIEINLSQIPLDDEKTFRMLTAGETVGVFQVESAGMRRALVDMRPDRFEDLIALVALYRPGPMANIPTYCARKLGQEDVEYLHPMLEPILAPTYGIITYQEQVQQIARDMAGYSLAEADILRRAMGKKIKAEMDAQRGRFTEGAQERGIDKSLANTVFDACAKFAEYGFNKSHSAPYAFITYQTAYMKANYPAEFMAASMTLDMGNTDKIAEFRREAMRLDITVEAPSINRSGTEFDVEDGRILYSLAAIKGVGGPVVESLVGARGDTPFKSLGDFAGRIDPKVINKRTVESLTAAGAFDELEPDRARVHGGIDRILGEATRKAESAESGQNELFGGGGEPEAIILPDVEPWLAAEKLQREHSAVGFYLSAHPLDEYREILERMRVQTWAEFTESVRGGATAGRLAGTITAKQERRIRTGSRMAAVQISDPSGSYEAVIFSESLATYRDLLEPGRSVVVLVSAEDRPEGINVRISSVEPLDKFVAGLKQLRVFLRDGEPVPSVARHLTDKGEGAVSMILLLEEGRKEVEVNLPGRYAVTPQIASALRAVRGVVQVEMV